jgi:tRNA(fMet)-specific endonuclease VapC
MHLIDTDTLTHLHAGHEGVSRRLRECTDSEVGITIITRIELLRGRFDYVLKAKDASALLRAQNLLLRTERLLADLLVVPLDQQAVREFERLRTLKGLKKRGRADLLIASIALAHHAVLVTRNLRDFQGIPQLQVVNWLD